MYYEHMVMYTWFMFYVWYEHMTNHKWEINFWGGDLSFFWMLDTENFRLAVLSDSDPQKNTVFDLRLSNTNHYRHEKLSWFCKYRSTDCKEHWFCFLAGGSLLGSVCCAGLPPLCCLLSVSNWPKYYKTQVCDPCRWKQGHPALMLWGSASRIQGQSPWSWKCAVRFSMSSDRKMEHMLHFTSACIFNSASQLVAYYLLMVHSSAQEHFSRFPALLNW